MSLQTDIYLLDLLMCSFSLANYQIEIKEQNQKRIDPDPLRFLFTQDFFITSFRSGSAVFPLNC